MEFEIIFNGDISQPDRGILGMPVHPIVPTPDLRSPFRRNQQKGPRAEAREQRVYACLDHTRPQTLKAITKQLPGMHRNTVYDALQRLIKKNRVLEEAPILGGRVGPPLYRRG